MNPIMTHDSESNTDTIVEEIVPDSNVESAAKTAASSTADDFFAAPAKSSPPRRGFWRSFFASLMVVVLGFGGGLAAWYVADEYLGSGSSSGGSDGAVFQPTNRNPTSTSKTTDDSGAMTPREVYAAMAPAVAHIDSRIVKTTTDFFGGQSEEEAEGTGSGFIIDSKGHILTNAHVVQNASEVTVSLGKDNVKVPATVVGEDPSSDMAVLKFDPDAKELDGVELAVAKFGDSEAAQVGDPVMAIGNPFGLDRTLTTGVVSALQRNIPSLNDFSISDVIQTDAAVNPGNSGGPLLNANGEVIGVNSQISTRGGGFDGIAFAVPSATAKRVSQQLIKSGSIEYAWLGVEGGELTSDLVKQLNLKVKKGVYLGSVIDDSPADKAGLEGGRRLQDLVTGETVVEGGDVLTSFDGVKLTSMTQLSGLVDEKRPGDKVKVDFIRNGKSKTTTITLGKRPADIKKEG